MRIITGDEMGLLKATALESKQIVVAGKQTRDRAIKASCWTKTQSNKSIFALARADGPVTLWQDAPKAPSFLKEIKGLSGPDVVGMDYVTETGRLLVVHEDGSITVNKPFTEEEGDGMDEGSGDDEGWDVKGPLSCIALHETTLAAGGKERELGLWDVETHKSIWEARNVPHDKLDLRQPVWVTAISFLDETGQTLAIGTAYKQIRIYDVRVQRRPIRDLQLEGYRITSLCNGIEAGKHVVTGDAGGTVLHYDIGKMRLLGRLEGPAGSIRGLVRHPDPSLPFVAIAGLDRMARVYDLRRPRKEVYRYYLKQRLNTILFAAEGRKGKGKGEEEEEKLRATTPADEDELDELPDDVGSMEEGSSSDEDDGMDDDDDEGEEEEEEARANGKAGAKKKAGESITYKRVYGGDEQEEEEEDDDDSDEDDDGSDDDSEEEEEEIRTFGRRNDGPAKFELNITGVDKGQDDDDDDDDDDDEEEEEEEGEDESSEEEEEEDESSEEEEELVPKPKKAASGRGGGGGRGKGGKGESNATAPAAKRRKASYE